MIDSDEIHPMRFMRTRPFADRVRAIWRRTSYEGMPTQETLQAVMTSMTTDYNTAIVRLPVEERPRKATPIMVQEGSLAIHFARFLEGGRNIFALGPTLTEMLGQTDLRGIRAGDVHLPYPAFHVAIDPVFQGSLPGPDNRIDGFYINAAGDGQIEFMMTTRRLDSNPRSAKGWPFTRDLNFYAVLDFSDPEMDLAEIVDDAVRRGEINISSEMLSPIEGLDDMGSALGITVRDVRQQTSDEAAAFQRDGLPSFRQALGLVVGAICYLNSREQNSLPTPRYPDDAPPADVAILSTGTGSKGARQRASASLLDRGYMVTRLLEVPSPRQNLDSSAGSGREMPVHWRRGHFRRQAHGSREMPQHRLTWIHPVLVNGLDLEPGQDPNGRVYRL